MKATAPGKLVLSGAYSVLWGAPALVTAVDRYVVADTARTADFVTPEVACAIGRRSAPWFDASALRAEGRKLGLGSSAAIVVASLGALALEDQAAGDVASLAARVFPIALAAHRTAQGGGSGVDVAASSFGGTLRCTMRHDELEVVAQELPTRIEIAAYADRRSSSTAGMVAAVRAWAAQEPAAFGRLIGRLGEHAARTATAVEPAEFVQELRAQAVLLGELGDAAGAPIVPAELRAVAQEAATDGVVVMPSGAGGGDMVLCIGLERTWMPWGARLEAMGMARLRLGVGAPGLRGA